LLFFFFQAEDGIRDRNVTGVQTCALPISFRARLFSSGSSRLGMTALYPSREDPELNRRALKVLAGDKKNESNSLMDGAWTGHPEIGRASWREGVEVRAGVVVRERKRVLVR